MHILIAEDEAITRKSLTRQLEAWGHSVTATEDGEKAWAAFNAGGFDMVVTDWEMPVVSGVELVQRIRKSVTATYVYVILLTGRSDKSDIVRGIEAGADDFVSKPFDREELRVRLLAGERIVKLERALTAQNAALRDANERVRFGLLAAARVQRAMLPGRNISTAQIRTAWSYVSTDELAGDAVGLHMIDDRHLVFYVLDVSGHGVPAALLSVSAMHAMEPSAGAASLLLDATRSGGMGPVQRPARVATELNRRFRAGDIDGRFMTMFLCVLDTHTGELTYTSAGHPPMLILRGKEIVLAPDAGSLPIAIIDEAEYHDASIRLQPGDRVYLFSDGILEQTDAADAVQFGEGRLIETLAALDGMSIEQSVESVVEALENWAGSKCFTDDVSLVATEWLGP